MKTICTFLLLSFVLAFPSKAEISPQPDSISVYVFMLDACVICKHYSLALNELHREYAGKNLNFVGLFPNFSSKPEAIASFREKYRIPFELKTDYYRTFTDRFGVTVTPEVVVYNHTKKEVLYQGRIDNTYAALGKRRRHTTTSELKDVLQAIKEGSTIETQATKAIGCLINKNDRL